MSGDRSGAFDEDLRRQGVEGREANEIFRVVVEATPSAIVLASAEGRILLVNAGAEKLFGYAREDMIGQPVDMLLPERFRGAYPGYRMAYAGQAETRPTGKDRDLFALRKDGSEVPVEIELNPITTSAGSLILSAIIDVTERKRAEEAVRASEERMRLIIETALDAVITIDSTGVITGWNPQAESTFGWTCQEAIGRLLSETIIPDRYREAHQHGMRRYLATGEAVVLDRRIEITALHRDGREFPVELAITPIRIGESVSFSAFVRDITERKQAEEARRASEESYRTLFEYAPDGIVIANLEGVYSDANASICRMLGYTRDELIGLHASNIVAEAEIPHIGPALSQIESRVDYHRVWQFRRKDGSIFEAEVIATMMPDGNLMAMIRDITERKRIEAAAARLAAIVESSDDAIIGKDLSGIVTSWNAGAEKTFGYSAQEMVGQPIGRLIPRERQHEEVDILDRSRRGVSIQHFDTVRLRKDGSPIDVSITISPIKDSAGKIVGASKVARDISERKQWEDKIRGLNAELEQRVVERTAQLEIANKELEAFSYSVSHDLRAPLRAVDGFSQAVLEDYGPQLPEEGRRYLLTIRQGAQKMGMLIDDLLTFSRLSRAPINEEQINTGRLVRGVLDDLAAQREGRQIDLRIGELPPCTGDPALLKQVWTNLLSNALKYTQKRETAVVEIGSKRSPEGHVYFVRDNGTGFDMRYAGKLFGVFQRLHRAEDYTGTGVGLALVQRIIHRHGGFIWAEAEVDRGATFYFTLKEKITS
jgi:PAS domain S-box-containing protein